MDEVVSTESLNMIIRDALPAVKCSTISIHVIRDPDLSVNEFECIMKMIFINHSGRASVTNRVKSRTVKVVKVFNSEQCVIVVKSLQRSLS